MAKYIIKKGDTYWGIAKALTGRGGQYNKLVELNHTPSVKLKIGQVIEVPDEWVTPKSTKLFKGTPKAGDVIKGDELFDDYTYTAADEELDNKIANDTYLKTHDVTANTRLKPRLRISTSKSVTSSTVKSSTPNEVTTSDVSEPAFDNSTLPEITTPSLSSYRTIQTPSLSGHYGYSTSPTFGAYLRYAGFPTAPFSYATSQASSLSKSIDERASDAAAATLAPLSDTGNLSYGPSRFLFTQYQGAPVPAKHY